MPVFLAAFVALDEKKMAKKSKFSQMTILSAGTFANILTAVLFFGILWLFFSLAFTPSGIVFDTYTYSIVGITGISSINGISLNNASYEKVLSLINETGFNEIKAGDNNYLITKDFWRNKKAVKNMFFMMMLPQ